MPVTIQVASHGAREAHFEEPPGSAEKLLRKSCPSEHARCKAMIQSSFDSVSITKPVYPASNGLVRAAIIAYSSHHHLVLRPEDIWFAILTQLGFFVNAHAENLREFFVSHQGQKELEVVDLGTIYSVDLGALAVRMTELISNNVNDPELRTWIMPNFSTTTESDKTVAAILMMGALQEYFTYKFKTRCGIPSVTLLGFRADWEEMLNRLEMLPRLGEEPNQFYHQLKPILRHFVASFDSPSDFAVTDFWTKIAHRKVGSGVNDVSGWITALCFWDEKGNRLGQKGGLPAPQDPEYCPVRKFDATVYPRIEMADIPAGYATVPVKVDDNGVLYDTIMVAGSVGISIISRNENTGLDHGNRGTTYVDGQGSTVLPVIPRRLPAMDTLKPLSGWWIYEVSDHNASDNKQVGQGRKADSCDVPQIETSISMVEEPKKIPRWRKDGTAGEVRA